MGNISVPAPQLQKQRHKEVKECEQGNMDGEWQGQDSSCGC